MTGHSGTRVVPAVGSWYTLVGGAGVFVNEARIWTERRKRVRLLRDTLTLALREEGGSDILGYAAQFVNGKIGLDSEEINNRTSRGLHDPEANI